MKKLKSLTAAAIIISLLIFGFDFKQVYAENNSYSSGIDVVFVIDSSKSMSKSDPEGLTAEAMKMFIDMCRVKGDKAGMAAYSGNIVREYSIKGLNSELDKTNLKNTLINLPLGSWTDIGLGLKKAVNILKKGNSGGNKPIIILLSDGKNDPERDKKESEQDLSEALYEAKLNKYPIYTIGLNADGTVDKTSLQNISKISGGKSFITNTSEELPQILKQVFADNFNLKILQQNTLTGNDSFQQIKINIPDNNETEANISISASSPIEIKLSDPKGSYVKIPSDKFIYSKSAKYSLIKLISPEKGLWTLYVKGSSRDKISISLISNYDLKTYIKLSPESAGYKGDKISIMSYLQSNGRQLEDSDIYSFSKAVLIVNDLDKSEVKEYPMEFKDNMYTISYTLNNDDRYQIKVRIESPGFIRESEIKTFGAENRKPVIGLNFKSITLWNGKNTNIVLSQYFTDADNDKLKFSVINENPGIAEAKIRGDVLSIQGKKFGSSKIKIICDDGKGGILNTELGVRIFFLSYLIYGTLLLILIIIAVIAYICIKNKKNQLIPGHVMIEIKEGRIIKDSYYKALGNLKKSFSLHELLNINPAYEETEKIKIKAVKGGKLIIINKSECDAEAYGEKITASKRFIMKNNYKFTVKLKGRDISIIIKYFS